MTKKYEKFEAWMLHAPVATSNGKKGVVGDYIGGNVCVYFEDGSDWYMLNDVEFLEEVDQQEETSPIPWKVGQVVWDTRFTHQGVVIGVDTQFVTVKFGTKTEIYFLDGKSSSSMAARRVLFFSEPIIIADTMPPKKPFIPKLKEGDKVLIKYKQGFFGEGAVRVVHKECDDRIYVSKDGDYFMKYDIASVQVIGEEIKWES